MWSWWLWKNWPIASSSRGGGHAPFCNIGNHCMCGYQSITLKMVNFFLGKANILVLHRSLTKIWKLLKFPVTNICRKQGPAANDASSWILGHILLSEYGNSLTFGGRYARELFWCYSWLCRPSWSFLYLSVHFCTFHAFFTKMWHTNRWMDWPTDGYTLL